MKTIERCIQLTVVVLLFGVVACNDNSLDVDENRTADNAPVAVQGKAHKINPDITLSPSGDATGAVDAANIEGALAAAAPGDVIQLTEGIYFINRTITAPVGFNGTLTGSGSDATEIRGVGSAATPFGNGLIFFPGNPVPIFGGSFFFIPEPDQNLEVSHMAMTLPDGFRTEVVNPFFNQNLISFITSTLGSAPANTNFTGLRLVGTDIDPATPAFLVSQPAWGISVLGDRDPNDFPIPSFPGGIHTVTDSEISKIGFQATLHEVMKDAQIVSSGNRFTEVKQTIYRYLEGSTVQVTRNELDAFSFGSIVVTQEGFPMPGKRNSVEISHNTINTQGLFGIEIGIIFNPAGAAFDLLIEKNTITKSGPDPIGFLFNLAGIGLAPGNNGAVIRNNTILGDGLFGILFDALFGVPDPFGVDESMLQGNNLQRFTPLIADYGLIFSDNNTVVGTGNATVLELGSTGNIITGLQNVEGETVGGRMQEAQEKRKEIEAMFN